MVFQTLENITSQDLVNAFNAAFKGYFVPFVMTEQQMNSKLRLENFAPEYSVAALVDGKIVGFILHSFRKEGQKRLVYNGGTGVIAAYRGQGITRQMYNFIKPKLEQAAIDMCLLEVIDKNEPAKYSYEKIGFKKVKTLTCWKQQEEILSKNIDLALSTEKIADPNWNKIRAMGTWIPTWSNNIRSMQNDFAQQICLGLYLKEDLIAYGIVNRLSGRVAQWAVLPAYRRKGVGSYLMQQLRKESERPLSIINVDETASGIICFLKANNFINTINQYEMSMLLKK